MMENSQDSHSSQEMQGTQPLQRKISELKTLYEVAKAINSSLYLEKVMNSVLDVLHHEMRMERGTLTLLDNQTQELYIEVAHGLGKEQMARGRYLIGEGITGKVVQAGEPIAVPNVGNEPLFLDRTGARGDIKRSTISFICVPIKLDQKTIGALSVDRLFQENISLEEDVRLLTIISSMISQAVRNHLERQEEREKLETENLQLKNQLKKKFHPANIIGESKRMADVFASIELVSRTRATVFLRGESGTGKELVANAVHYNSDRANGPFIKISCAALPENLLESELFGYEKGAFTGAVTNKLGRFELADGGTLFLDEIGDVSPNTQVKLLRVLQEKEFERVGGTKTIHVDIRLIVATNKNLEVEVESGRFRQDLYYRLNVIPIFLPSLRDRKEDIPVLVNYFIEKANKDHQKKVKYIGEAALELLMNYVWPGNVRELENAIERAVILCKSQTLEPGHFPITPVLGLNRNSAPEAMKASLGLGSENGVSLTEAVEHLEKKLIQEALDKTSGNQRKASKLLGITERILGYKMRTYGLK